MAKIFEFKGGSLIDQVSKTAGTLTDGSFKRTEKGLAIHSDGGSGQVIDTNQTFNFNYNEEWTIEIAFRVRDYTTGRHLLSDTTDGTSVGRVVIRSTKLFGTTTIIDGIGLEDNLVLAPNKWYHYICVNDGAGNLTYYRDGSSNTIVNDTSDNNFTITDIASRRGGGTSFTENDGDIAYVRFYDHAVSTQERISLQKDFLNSYGTEEQKRNFTYPKPSDLSSEVDSVVGSNVIFNSGFDTDTGWGKTDATNTISDGVGHFTNSATYKNFYQTNKVVSGVKYKVIYTIKNYVTGTFNVQLGTQFGTVTSGNGTYTNEITANGTGVYLQPMSGTNTYDIDDFYVYPLSGLVAAYNMIPSAD